MRKICPNCRREYTPTDEELENISLDRHALDKRKFYRGEGCSECLNTGYRGRTAVFEILMMTADIKQKFHERAPREELLKAIYASGFQTILHDCIRLVLDGITTAEEAYRVLHSTDA